MCWKKKQKKQKKPMIYNLLTSMTKTFIGLLYSNVAGLVVVLQLGVICWTKTIYSSEIWWTKVPTWRLKYMSTRLCQNFVFLYMLSNGTWETTCFKVWSSMDLSCTFKDFLLIYIQDLWAKGNKCLWNNWGGGEKGRKK